MGNYCTRWHHCFKGLSLDGNGRIFLKSLPDDASFYKDLSNKPTSAGSISLDSTFKDEKPNFIAIYPRGLHVDVLSTAVVSSNPHTGEMYRSGRQIIELMNAERPTFLTDLNFNVYLLKLNKQPPDKNS